MHCAVCMCTRSAPEIVQNALVLLRNIIEIIKTHIHDNHIEFEVSGRFGGVWQWRTTVSPKARKNLNGLKLKQ